VTPVRNVLVTAAASPLGCRLLEYLRDQGEVERLVGVEPGTGSGQIRDVELVKLETDHRELVGFLARREIDTVIHCGLAPDRSGGCSEPSEARVIDTMRLGAAVASPEARVRSWVVASSSAVYPVSSHAPLLHREDGEVDAAEGSPGASVLEAEEYARDIAARTPHLNVAILRLQQPAGAGVASPLSSLLAQPVLPAVIGFDAPLQLLAIEDAVHALAFAARVELAGVYNVASSGTIRFSDAVRALGRRALPVLPLEAGPLAPLARRLGLPHVPAGLLGVLRFGHALDTTKLAAAGFAPEHDQASCLLSLRR
jgi:nucleoside-diphosphate-sugar epimerase